LPGFEFTATFGFHILGIFPPTTTVREVEHLLLNLRVPGEALDSGSSNVGATSDVLSAYRLINEAGGLAIAAHANSSNGVAMRGFNFGGQTKIAYTQDPSLHALEVTDLDARGHSRTAGFFNGTKPEYPRRMHCIQGSDAHRLRADPANKKNLGVGDRATEVLVDDVSFDALRELFSSNDFARTRPHWPAAEEAFDFLQQAQEEGPSINQAFHESMAQRGGKLYAVISRRLCAGQYPRRDAVHRPGRRRGQTAHGCAQSGERRAGAREGNPLPDQPTARMPGRHAEDARQDGAARPGAARRRSALCRRRQQGLRAR
jgi:hypothetical protein